MIRQQPTVFNSHGRWVIFLATWSGLTIRILFLLTDWGTKVCTGQFLELKFGESASILERKKHEFVKGAFLWINLLINFFIIILMFCYSCVLAPMYAKGYRDGQEVQFKEDM